MNFNPKSRGIKNAALLLYYNNALSPLRIPLYGTADDAGGATDVVMRVKSAADTRMTIAGKVWEPDLNYRKGSIKLDKQVVAGPIAGTDDDILYQTYLSAAKDLAETRVEIPLANGEYQVRIHFVENYFNAVGARVFNLAIENEQRLANFDIYREVGYRAALVKDFGVKVTDGTLHMKFNPTVNRLAIAGVEIFKYTPSNVTGVAPPVEVAERQIRVFPNPGVGETVQVVVENFDKREPVTIVLHDVVGKIVHSQTLVTNDGGEAKAALAISAIKNGLYIIKAYAPSGEMTTKLVVDR